MNTDLEIIENYVTGQLSSDERVRFETALRTDPAVADALAFYMLTKQVAREESRNQRKAEFDALRTKPAYLTGETKTRTRPMWSAPMRWVAAAGIFLLLGLGWYFFRPRADSTVSIVSQQVDNYTSAHFRQLPTTMDGGSTGSGMVDSLKMGVGLFNEGKLAEAGAVFNNVLLRHPNSDGALKYAGIVSFRQGNYDKAISLFHRLSQRTDLYGNPGPFYESLTLLKRGRPIDKSQVKKLLDKVIINNLEGKKEAESLRNQL
ncbi:hypothetical protein [Spirosoma flavum]|uniref:Tetratricopeptide repeat protein n=1 Tax=Spirosoma flavum TaxID=2048557 RepID=A0ABW6AFW2_9BACT